MEKITKVDQKYKGTRRIERRLLIPKKQLTKYPKDYVHKVKKELYYKSEWGRYPIETKYKLIYQ